MPACHLVQIHTLHQHIAALLAFRLGYTRHIAHFGGDHRVLEVVRLIYHEAVHTELFKGHDIVLAALVVELVQLALQLFFHAFHLLDGKVFGACRLEAGCLLHHIVDLLLQVHLLAFKGKRDFFKLAVSDDDDIKVAGGDAGTELFSVCLFKIRFAGNQNFGVGVQQQSLGCHLLGQVVGHYDQRFAAKPQPLFLHGTGHHLEGLPCPHFVCQQHIVAVQHMGDGVALVRAQGDFGVHAGEMQVAAVILARAQAVEFGIVHRNQPLAARRFLEDPVLKLLADQALLFLRCLGSFLIQNISDAAVRLPHLITDLDRAQVQRAFGNRVGIGAVGAVGHGRLDVAVPKAFVADGPLAGNGSKVHLDHAACQVRRVQQLG